MLVTCDPGLAHPRPCSLALLDRHLAAMIDLHRQVKHAQWNVVGCGAVALRGVLDQVATTLDYCCDLIAAHAALLGGAVNGTVQVAAARSFLGCYPLATADARAHASAVFTAMEAVAGSLRDAGAAAAERQDRDTAALLIEVARFIERDMWHVGAATVAAADKIFHTRAATRVGANPNGKDRAASRWSDRPVRFVTGTAASGGGAASEALS